MHLVFKLLQAEKKLDALDCPNSGFHFDYICKFHFSILKIFIFYVYIVNYFVTPLAQNVKCRPSTGHFLHLSSEMEKENSIEVFQFYS